MMWYYILPVLGWILLMTFLLTPTSTYTGAWDRLTRARWRKDREGLAIMLSHLAQFPEEWSFGRTEASFPKEGSKQIMLNYDKDSGWEYALSSFGGNFRPLNGHFAHEFDKVLTLENNKRESAALMRNLYPELNGTLLLK